MKRDLHTNYGVWTASGSLVWGDGNQYIIVPLDIREMYMNKYFEHGNFMKKEYVDWQKLYNYLEDMVNI